MSDAKKVKACPVCGIRIQNHCYHDGNEVSSMLMLASESIQKLTDEIAQLQDRIDELTAERDAVKNLCEHDRLNDHGDACLDCGAVYVDGEWQ